MEAKYYTALVVTSDLIKQMGVDPQEVADELFEQPVLLMGRDAGICRRTWVDESGGVSAEIELDPAHPFDRWEDDVKAISGA